MAAEETQSRFSKIFPKSKKPLFEDILMVLFGLVSWAILLTNLPLADSIPIYAGY
mgnify:CR=1 FL=1